MHANIAARNNMSNSWWMIDSGASRYMTNDPQILMSASDFTGTDEIIIGGSNVIPISNIGNITLSNSNFNSFVLNNVLCAPHVRKKSYFNMQVL